MGASHSDNSPLNREHMMSKVRSKLASVDPDEARALGGVFLFNIIKGNSVYSWTLDLNKLQVYEGEPEEDPDTTFTLSEAYLRQITRGGDEARAVMQAGRCSVTGDITRAMKLEPYIKID